jgi:arginase
MISLIGAPCDAGANRPGACRGPQALRASGLLLRLRSLGLEVQDCGDLQGPANSGLPATGGYRHLPEVVAWSTTVHEAVHTELALGHLPLLLGGDHSLAVGSISAVARHCRDSGKTLRILWLDAHADCNSRRTSPSGNLHGMPVACLCGLGPPALIGLSGQVPAINPASLRQIGIRSVDEGEVELVHTLGLAIDDMQVLHTLGMRTIMARALAGLDANTHLHVSFDVDFLGPDLAPGVSAAVPGGPSREEAQLCMDMIAQTGRLASLDVMELNPALDKHQATASIAVDLITRLLGRHRPIDSTA